MQNSQSTKEYRVTICIYLRDQNVPAIDNCVMSIAPTHIHFAVSAPKATGRDYSKQDYQ